MQRHSLLVVLCLIIFSFIFPSLAFGAANSLDEEELKTRFKAKVATIAVPFIENRGQVDKRVAYYAKTFGGTVFVTRSGELVYSLPADKGGVALREVFIGAKDFNVRGEDRAETKVSYFRGKDRSKWVRGLSTYNYVDLGEVWRGVRVKVKAYGKRVEKLFYIEPEVDVREIRVEIKGAKGLQVTGDGRLRVVTEKGDVYFTRPLAYQEVGGKKRFVEVAYVVKGKRYGFEVGEYDHTRPLIIDPLLASTYLGGSSDEYIYAIALDSAGNVYVAGETDSSDFPVTDGAYNTIYSGNGDAFISKFDGNLTTLYASTYLGGNSWEGIDALVIDSAGNVYVAGETWSSDFPVTDGAYDTIYNGGYVDGFISKLDSNLTTLYASTFLGGSNEEYVVALALDSAGNVYVAGGTSSSDFPVTDGAYDTSFGGGYGDAFISKLDSNLTTLYASTFLGGSDEEYVVALALDSSGNVYVAGGTSSSDFPVTNGAYDTIYNGADDAFISKFDSNLTTLYASTFLGGSDEEYVVALALDSSGNVYVAGGTSSSDFPVTNGAYDTSFGGGYYSGDGFISKFDGNLTTFYASTFLGGSSDEGIYALGLDSSGNVYVAGETWSSDFPVTDDAYKETLSGVEDSFISKLNSNLTTLYASTFLGGSDAEEIYALALNSSGNVYVAGETYSPDFPVTNGAYDTRYNGYSDAFISKLDGNLSGVINQPPVINSFNATPTTGQAPLEVTFTCNASDSDGYIVEYRWNFGDGNTENTTNGTITHTYENPGTYNATCTVVDDDNATATSKPVSITVTTPTPNEPPEIISFTAEPTSGGAPLDVRFTCEATDPDGSIDHYVIEFGDGENATSTTGVVTHTYNDVGMYQAHCSAYDDQGASTTSNPVTITVNAPASNKPPVIESFTAEPTSGYAPLEVTFTCKAQDPDGSIVAYEWDFGGAGSFNKIVGTDTVVHTYEEPGTYNVTCKVIDDDNGASDSKSIVIKVISSNEPPEIMSFKAETNKDGSSFEVTFTCEAEDPDGYIEKYEWDFDGDGRIDEITEDNYVVHEYEKAGVYYARVKVVDNEGEESTAGPVKVIVGEGVSEVSGGGCSANFGNAAVIDVIMITLPLLIFLWTRSKKHRFSLLRKFT